MSRRRVSADPGVGGVRWPGPGRRAVGLVAALLLLGLGSSAVLPANLHAPLVLRLLGYDRRFPPDARPTVVLVGDGSTERRLVLAELDRALQAAARPGVGLVVVHATLPEVPTPPTGDAVPLVVVLAEGLAERVPELRLALASRTVLTIGSDEESVRAGLALGVVRRDDRPALLVNRKAAAAEGARLEAGLLRLARPVDGGAP